METATENQRYLKIPPSAVVVVVRSCSLTDTHEVSIYGIASPGEIVLSFMILLAGSDRKRWQFYFVKSKDKGRL